MNKLAKYLTAAVFSGVLSVSALAGTVHAQGRMTACCPNPRIVDVDEYEYGDPSPTTHAVYQITGTRCSNCGHEELVTEKIGYEEHDYDIYHPDSNARSCKCGDTIH